MTVKTMQTVKHTCAGTRIQILMASSELKAASDVSLLTMLLAYRWHLTAKSAGEQIDPIAVKRLDLFISLGRLFPLTTSAYCLHYHSIVGQIDAIKRYLTRVCEFAPLPILDILALASSATANWNENKLADTLCAGA